jgi:ABC-2 type transport system permease protein
MTTTIELPTPPQTRSGRLWWMLRDGWTITRRELGHVRRDPGQLIAAVIFPAIMVLLFGYVFGSAIKVPGGGNYREYLLPGLFAMSAVAGVMASALLVSKDVAEGVMDRFRSMPMARSAVPFGRTAADLLGAAIGVAIMAGIALLVGWRAHHGLAATLAAFGLILLLRYAVSWIGVWVGMSVTPQTADSLVPLVFPVSMISNSFVPTAGNAALAAPGRRLEPHQRAGRGLPGPVRQPHRRHRARQLPVAASGRHDDRLVAAHPADLRAPIDPPAPGGRPLNG